MNNKYDFKVLIFRVLTAGYTAFFASFANAYSVKTDFSASLHIASASALAGVITGFGLDQLIYHFLKKSQAK
jgi:hypothetical protein